MSLLSNWRSRFEMCSKVEITEVTNNNCTDSEISSLLDIFEFYAKRLTLSGAREAVFDLADFGNAQERDLTKFILTIERKKIDETNRIFEETEAFDMYDGTFTHETNKKSITVSGTAPLFLNPNIDY